MKPLTENQKPIPMNGFSQVVDMLQAADPNFRNSILKKIAATDARLAHSFIEKLKSLGVLK